MSNSARFATGRRPNRISADSSKSAKPWQLQSACRCCWWARIWRAMRRTAFWSRADLAPNCRGSACTGATIPATTGPAPILSTIGGSLLTAERSLDALDRRAGGARRADDTGFLLHEIVERRLHGVDRVDRHDNRAVAISVDQV